METDFSCTMCLNVVEAVTKTIVESYDTEGLKHYIKLLCSLYYDSEVCNTYIDGYAQYAINALVLRIGNKYNFCHKLNFCPEGELTEDVYDMAHRLLKNKPQKKREKIDTTAPVWKMIQLTDIHLDLSYLEGSSVFCDEPVCCREKLSNYSRITAGKFGYLGRCDANAELLNSFVEKAYELSPDFIIWTGDNSPHNSKGSTQEDNYNATNYVKTKLYEKFGTTIPIYPALGNHEIYPADLYIGNEENFLETYANIFKEFFTEEQAYESFKNYGYYTEKYKDNLRIVVLNCLLCDTWNFYIISGKHNAAKKEFVWLEEVLLNAENNNEYVYIIDHFPINSNFQLNECAKRLRALFDRFDYIIRGIFSGHTHLDDISPVRAYFEPKPIININYIAPPLTTYPKRNPSFRMFLLDSNTKNVIDYQQYRLNLTEANEKGEANWYITYNATSLYNVTDCTEIEKMCNINVEGDYIKQRYAEGESEKKEHDKKQIKNAKCQIQTDTYHDFYMCSAGTVFSLEYFFEFFNDLSGEWAVNEDEINDIF